LKTLQSMPQAIGAVERADDDRDHRRSTGAHNCAGIDAVRQSLFHVAKLPFDLFSQEGWVSPRLLERFGCFRHFLSKAERPHIGPHLFDVRQTFRFGAALSRLSPTPRGFSIGRPYGVLLLVIDDYFVDRIVLSIFSIHFPSSVQFLLPQQRAVVRKVTWLILPRQDHCIPHPRVLAQHRLDLYEVNAVASDLDLKVFAPEMLKTAIGQHASQVSREVNLFVSAFGVGQKFSLCEVWPSPVARGEIATLHSDLPDTVFLPINLINMVLRHLPIDGHSRPVEVLGGPADIPIGGDEDRKQRMSLVQGKVFGIPEPPAKVLGQVHEGNSAVVEVCDRNL